MYNKTTKNVCLGDTVITLSSNVHAEIFKKISNTLKEFKNIWILEVYRNIGNRNNHTYLGTTSSRRRRRRTEENATFLANICSSGCMQHLRRTSFL